MTLKSCVLRRKKSLVLISGAGTSIAYNLPATTTMTTAINSSLRSKMSRMPQIIKLFDEINNCLANYLRRPGTFTFEDIYEAIIDVYTTRTAPTAASGAFDEFRPRIAATHELVTSLRSYSDVEIRMLQSEYLRCILSTFNSNLTTYSDRYEPRTALALLKKKYAIWSYTLNYDPFLDNALQSYEGGFGNGPAPRGFASQTLLSAITQNQNIHAHLHGSMKWGWGAHATDPFQIHEYDTPADGLIHSQSNPSGRPSQSGDPIISSTVITGLNKLESIYSEPYLSISMSLMFALQRCSKLIIAGYGFGDRHINQLVSNWRKEDARRIVYIVDFDSNDHPSSFFDVGGNPAKWHTIYPGPDHMISEVTGNDGWWRMGGENNGGYHTGPVFLWLRGFNTFCQSIVGHGLPD